MSFLLITSAIVFALTYNQKGNDYMKIENYQKTGYNVTLPNPPTDIMYLLHQLAKSLNQKFMITILLLLLFQPSRTQFRQNMITSK